MAFGFLLMVVLAILATIIGLGKVEQSTSYGLQHILDGLVILSSQFAVWCFIGGRQQKRYDGESERKP